jgi:cytochrome c
MELHRHILICALVVLAGYSRAFPSKVLAATGEPLVRGRKLIEQFHCGSCHTIPGVQGAVGTVGPPLILFAKRSFIAGEVPNTQENLIRWIMSPQSIEKDTAMPQLGLTDAQARDVAAYLYTLRSKTWYGDSQ